MEDRSDSKTITRRKVLERAGGGAIVISALPAILAACGGGGSSSAGGTVAGGGGTPKAGGTIDFLGVQGEDGKGVAGLEGFLKENGASLSSTYTTVPPEVVQRFKSGRASGVDMVDYSQAQVPEFNTAGVLAEIDPEQIPNLKNLLPEYAGTEQPWYIDGKLYGVPYYNGPFTPVWDSRAITKPITSWDQFQDPSLKGRLGFYASPEAALAIAAIATGAAADPTIPGNVPKEKKQEVAEWLEPVMGNVRSFATSLGDLINQFKARDIDAAFGGWGGFAGIAAGAGIKTIEFTALPSPGTPATVEVWMLSSGADNPDGVLAYMNEVLKPKPNGEINLFLAGGPTVKGAYDSVPALKKIIPPGTYEGKLGSAELPFLTLPPVESDEFITLEEWASEFTKLSGA